MTLLIELTCIFNTHPTDNSVLEVDSKVTVISLLILILELLLLTLLKLKLTMLLYYNC